jgi:hypothetical protein
MRTRNVLPVAAAMMLSLIAARADAQTGRWSVEGRIGSTLPTGDLTSAAYNQTSGMAISADLMHTLRPNVSLFGGVGHHRFDCSGCSRDVSSTGVNGGVKFLLESNGRTVPWMRAGVAVNRAEVGNETGEWSPGLDSGVGVDWSLNDRITLVPALRYNRYSDEALTLSYFTIDVGGHMHVGD